MRGCVAVLLLPFLLHPAFAAENCPCPGRADDSKLPPAPAYSELQRVTDRINQLSAFYGSVLKDNRYPDPSAKTDRFRQCLRSDFSDIMRFVQLQDINSISLAAYGDYVSAYFQRHSYSTADVIAAIRDLAVYSEIDAQRQKNPYDRAHPFPEVVAATPCELEKMKGHGQGEGGPVSGFFDSASWRVYYDSCAPLQETAATVVHELTHAATYSQGLADLDAANNSFLFTGLIKRAATQGYSKAKAESFRLRYEQELQAYVAGAKAEFELRARFGTPAKPAPCEDTDGWMDWWQRFEGIVNAPSGYPKRLSAAEAAAIRKQIGCPSAP